MTSYLQFPFLSFGLGAIVLAAVLCLPRFHGKSPRRTALTCLSLAILFFGIALYEAVQHSNDVLLDPWIPLLCADALDALPLLVYALVAAISICIAPRRDIKKLSLTGIMLLVLGTEMIYSASNFIILNLGWWLTCVPFIFGFFGKGADQKNTNMILIASSVALTCTTLLHGSCEMTSMSSISKICVFCLMITVVLRKGLFPFHGWTLRSFETGPLLPMSLLFNSHLGALLVSRFESAQMPVYAHDMLNSISLLALATATMTSLMGLFEKKPRCILALVCTGQASFILSGLLSSNSSGVMGGMLHWMVVMIASTGLIAIVRILEVRIADVADPAGHLGLAVRAPRLATFFLISGLALVGLPGTLGYCGEDLLFHGVQEQHPIVGILLLIATTLNAINLIRLYSILFLGVLPKNVIEIPDALPRERWPLALLLVIIIVGGLYPALPVALRTHAMESLHLLPSH